MDIQIQSKKPFLKRYWWLIIILAVLLVIIGYVKDFYDNKYRPGTKFQESIDAMSRTKEGATINQGPQPSAKPFTDKQFLAANEALNKGIIIEEEQKDWEKFPAGSKQPDGRFDNSNTYLLPWTDYRSLSIGADEEYIYFKYRFWDIFPTKPAVYGDDIIYGTSAKITSFDFVNVQGKKDRANLADSIWWAIGNQDGTWGTIDTAMLDHVASITPTGHDERQETLHKTSTGEGLVGGGPGCDYLIAAYPLTLFGIKLGDEVTFDSSTETGSKLFHHEAVDWFLKEEGSKFGTTIRYKLGSNTYELLPGFDKSGHE